MKKTLSILTLLILAVSIVSAGSIYVDSGVSLSNGNRVYEVNSPYGITGKTSPIPLSVVSMPIEIGYNYSSDNGFITSVSSSYFIVLSEKMDGEAVEEEYLFPNSFVAKAQVGYGLKVNKKMNVELLGGISFALGTRNDDESNKASLTTLSIVAEAGINYELDDSLYLRAGGKVGFPLTTNVKYKDAEDYKITYSGFVFNFTPFAGVSYEF